MSTVRWANSQLVSITFKIRCYVLVQWEVVRPGATRLNLSWFSSEAELELVLGALELVAAQGWRLLPVYRFNNETGEWRHHSNSVFRSDTSLLNVSSQECNG